MFNLAVTNALVQTLDYAQVLACGGQNSQNETLRAFSHVQNYTTMNDSILSHHRLSHIQSARQAALYGEPAANSRDVQPWIVQSWQRCMQQGHRPSETLAFDVVAAAEQKRHTQANYFLASAAQETLSRLAAAIAQTRYFAILTNAQGMVVSSAGAIDRHDRRATLITRVGVDLSETAVGTTAIGATLAEKHTVWMHRGEHFYDDTAFYSCAGAPIWGPDGKCAGMLDVTGIDVPERPELAHLVAQSARRIETAMVVAQPHRLVLQVRWPDPKTSSQHWGQTDAGLICLDAHGAVVAMSQIARQMLDHWDLSNLSTHANDLFAMDFAQFFDAAQRADSVLDVPLWSGLRMQVQCQLASSEPSCLSGTHVRLGNDAADTPSPCLKEMETALIRKTVQDKRGNVAAAAKALGISRATVYRKLAVRR